MKISGCRIAVLSVHSSPLGKPGTKDTGGMSTYIREVAPELTKHGLLVDIYTRLHSHRDSQVKEMAPGVRLIHLRAGENKSMDKLLVYSYLPDFACNAENFRKQNALKYDLIFSHYWLSGVVGEILQGWWHVPHITMFHTVGAIKNVLGIGEDEPELRIETEGRLARDCDRVVAATNNERNSLARHYNAPVRKIRVIPCGVNLDLFQPADKMMAKHRLGFSDEKVILFVGRIEPLKGIDNLLKTMPYLQNGVRPKLVIIGGDGSSHSEIRRLRRLTNEMNITDSVTFSGLIDYQKMPAFYNAADVCVVPSYYESFGLVALESLACGTPIVTTDVGDLKNIVLQGETGYVVQDNSPLQLAEKISAILSRPVLSMESMKSIRASVAQYSWSNTSETLLELFREVLAK